MKVGLKIERKYKIEEANSSIIWHKNGYIRLKQNYSVRRNSSIEATKTWKI
jgi:hypothetical protein